MGTSNVDDIYELSPLQQGMLLHSVHDGAADMYLSQQTYTVEGALDKDALLRAWERVVAAHPPLRSSFHWQGLDKPLQVVHREVSLPAHHRDWSDADEATQRERLDQLLADDRAAGFDVEVAPLQRMHMIDFGGNKHCLIWTYHHVLMDGWSIPVFVNEVMSHYRSLTVGTPAPPPAPPYREYIGWLQRQDLDLAKAYWCDALAGVQPSRLTVLRPWDARRGTGSVDRRTVSLSADLGRGLREAAAKHRVTLNTVVQAAWAIVLRHYSEDTDITFGYATSGRPPELPNVERMIGLFSNTLPARITVPDDGDLGDWLRGIHESAARMRRYEYAPLASIKKWAGLPGQELFESLLVLENYSLAVDSGSGSADALRFQTHSLYDKINLPLTLTVMPEPVSELQLLIHRERFAPGFVEDILGCLYATLGAMATATRVAAVATAAGPPPAPRVRETVPVAVASGAPARPATPHEETIAAVFQEVLGVDAVDVTASFFDLGGDSFDAVRAIRRIEGATIGLLATHPSVRALAEALESASVGGLLRRLTRADTAAHTLVCVPMGGGSALSYQPLANALPDDIALVAVSLPGHEVGGDPELRPLDEVAEECVKLLLDSVDGPVSFYGHSTGVALAVDLARRFEAAGRPVERLFLAASYPLYDAGLIGRAFLRRAESPEALMDEARKLLEADGIDGVVDDDDLRFSMRATAHDLASARHYFSEHWPEGTIVAPLATPITFLAGASDKTMRNAERRYRRWQRFSPVVDFESVPGGHYFHQREADALAAVIRRYLPEGERRPLATAEARA